MHAASPTQRPTTPTTPPARRRSALKFGLAGLAVLGIGAGLTTAAWTDQVFFTADATAATFNLLGSDTPEGPWLNHASAGDALEIPLDTSDFGAITPSLEARTATVYVKNAGSTTAFLQVNEPLTEGSLFTHANSTAVVSASADTTELAPSEITPVTISLTPGDLPSSLAGARGTILVSVTGSTG